MVGCIGKFFGCFVVFQQRKGGKKGGLREVYVVDVVLQIKMLEQIVFEGCCVLIKDMMLMDLKGKKKGKGKKFLGKFQNRGVWRGVEWKKQNKVQKVRGLVWQD